MKKYNNLDNYHLILPGWEKIIELFLDDCQELMEANNYKMNFFMKEKFGVISINSEIKKIQPDKNDLNLQNQILDQFYQMSEYLSYLSANTCSSCGRPGWIINFNHYIVCLCNSCIKESVKQNKVIEQKNRQFISRELYDWGKNNQLTKYCQLKQSVNMLQKLWKINLNNDDDQVFVNNLKTEKERHQKDLEQIKLSKIPEYLIEDNAHLLYFKDKEILKNNFKFNQKQWKRFEKEIPDSTNLMSANWLGINDDSQQIYLKELRALLESELINKELKQNNKNKKNKI